MIQINDKIRITRTDKYCLQVEELCEVTNKKTNETRKEWKWKGYFGDLKTAISGILRQYATSLVDEDIKGCQEILKRLDELKNEFSNEIKVILWN